MVLLATVAAAAGCGGDPVSRAALERQVREHYRDAGYPRARVACARHGDAYRCRADKGGNDGADGIEHTSYSLTGKQNGDTSLDIP